MFVKEFGGVIQLVTRVSHNAREIGDSLIGEMSKQCALQNREFIRLVECSLSATDWDALVMSRCADGHNPFVPHRGPSKKR